MKTTAEPTRTRAAPLPGALLLRKCACGGSAPAGECDACRRGSQSLARRASGASEEAAAPPIVHDVLGSPGRPLDAAARRFFEPRFGHDFSHVRVHTDVHAAASARAVDAIAYTVGRHVVFDANRHDTVTPAGRELMAHELAHVVQQGGAAAPASTLRIAASGSAIESQADAAARGVMAGAETASLATTAPNVSRQAGAGAKCAATHTIPDDVFDAIGTAWAASGQGGATVAEHGGRVVTDKDSKRVIRTGAGGGGSISLPAEQAGDTSLGTFHTHPYSKSEGSKLGVGFSGGDITNFIAGGQGNFKYVGAGTCIYAMTTRDATARDACKSVDIDKRWNDRFAAASGNFQMKVDAATRAAIAGCGICYYGTCSPDLKTPVPKTARLA